MTASSNEGSGRKPGRSATVLTGAYLLAASLPLSAAGAPPPPSARPHIPTFYYQGITPNEVIEAYEQAFVHAGFIVKTRTTQHISRVSESKNRTFALASVKPPYYAELMFTFSYDPTAGKSGRTGVAQQSSAFSFGGALDPQREIEVQHALGQAGSDAQHKAEEAIGAYHLHEFDIVDH
ncbi:hypothetical protein EC912_105214 [Luteibacter rhizovicinus]|uniref:DUF4136 domain-containing protein n=1 Tax=Luteibacter rhizovicinus TaxID=242606 RepID=A0A4R3YQ75_9GAMM|nr:hypothetical protein [Luteibacter rhizovicinus]TCV93354.1 hypothetical protein EC912_105214 [Luteibacter rhizovicinus]